VEEANPSLKNFFGQIMQVGGACSCLGHPQGGTFKLEKKLQNKNLPNDHQ